MSKAVQEKVAAKTRPVLTGHAAVVHADAARLRALPGFRDVVPEVARSGLANMDSREHVSRELRDRGSYIIGMVAMSLYAAAGELTASGLAAVCAGAGISSAGRVQALVTQLKRVGGLRAIEGNEDIKRGQKLMPGPDLTGFFHDHFWGNSVALAKIDPRGALGLQLLTQGMVGQIISEILALSGEMGPAFNAREGSGLWLFTEHDSALAILQELISTGEKGDAAPLLGRTKISVSGLARRHVVSRPHVLKLLKDAHEIGALHWDAEARMVAFTEDFSVAYEHGMSLVLANTLTAYDRAAQKHLSASAPKL